jgi:hypothetical protein
MAALRPDLNAGAPWTEIDVADLKNEIAVGRHIGFAVNERRSSVLVVTSAQHVGCY